jgi:hypothetical protein
MNVQYISDSVGNTTGVFIPIDEWNELKDKYKDIEDETNGGVPEWQKSLVRKEIEDIENGTTQLLNWEDVKKQIKSR